MVIILAIVITTSTNIANTTTIDITTILFISRTFATIVSIDVTTKSYPISSTPQVTCWTRASTVGSLNFVWNALSKGCPPQCSKRAQTIRCTSRRYTELLNWAQEKSAVALRVSQRRSTGGKTKPARWKAGDVADGNVASAEK